MKRFLPRPTYANVVSTICLFLLLGGGAAWAATKLARNSVGTRQIKNGAITPKKLSAAALKALRAAGPTGLKGEPGVPGPKGEPGPSGRGPLEALGSGETIHGVWSVNQEGTGVSGGVTSQTFPIPAPAPVDANHVVVAGNDTEPGDGCSGTATAPVAAPGFVCVYIAQDLHTTSAEGIGALSLGGGEGASPYGFTIEVAGDGIWFADGSWAYTAP